MNAIRACIIVSIACLVAGCGGGDERSEERETTPSAPSPAAEPSVPTPALEAAEQFTHASRVTIPEQLRANHALRTRLATGDVLAELRRVGAPTAAQVRILERSRTGSNIDVLDVEGAPDGEQAAAVTVTVRERTWSQGAIDETTARYNVHLVERGDRWLVDQFTIDV